MIFVISVRSTEPLKWTLRSEDDGANEEVQVRYDTGMSGTVEHVPTQQMFLDHFKALLKRETAGWLTPGFEEWVLDLDSLRDKFPELSTLRWLRGKVSLRPNVTISENAYERERREQDAHTGGGYNRWAPTAFDAEVLFRVAPEVVKKAVMLAEAPLGIHHSLAHFRLDFPKPEEVAFIIMRFGKTDAHTLILEGIKKGLAAVGVTGIRADERQYHDDLFNNVLTFMHGCGLGIAVFERLEENDFPNVALEVGYMLAMPKPVCILKDRRLQAMQTDLMGKLYSEFDSLDPVATISQSLSVWLSNKKLA